MNLITIKDCNNKNNGNCHSSCKGDPQMEPRRKKSSLPRLLNPFGGVPSRRKSDQSDATQSTSAESEISEAFFERLTATTTTKPRKSVSFASHAKARFTLSRRSYTDQEKRAAFYCRDEYNVIKEACCRTVTKMEQGIDLSNSRKYCPRGLESYTKAAATLKKQCGLAGYAAVFSAFDDFADEERISEDYYQWASSSSRLWATTVGLRDQTAALEYYEEERRAKTTSKEIE